MAKHVCQNEALSAIMYHLQPAVYLLLAMGEEEEPQTDLVVLRDTRDELSPAGQGLVHLLKVRMTEAHEAMEELLVARNLRHMQLARAALQPGYYLRAARHLKDIHGTIIIGTGFPVAGTFETDGPVGAIAL